MKKYLVIILVITLYNSCDKDKPNPNPDPPAVKYCLNAKLDALIQDLKDKLCVTPTFMSKVYSMVYPERQILYVWKIILFLEMVKGKH